MTGNEAIAYFKQMQENVNAMIEGLITAIREDMKKGDNRSLDPEDVTEAINVVRTNMQIGCQMVWAHEPPEALAGTVPTDILAAYRKRGMDQAG